MLDLAGILFSSSLMLFVIMRAVQLDRVMPWFQTLTRRDAKDTAAEKRPGLARIWRKRG